MPVNPERRNLDMGQSLRWNANRKHNLECLSQGIIPPDLVDTQTGDGFYTVSRHAAGTRAAYVVQAKIRRLYPNLITRVINQVDNSDVEWNAEIRAKLAPINQAA